MDSIVSLTGAVLAFLCVLLLAYYGSRVLGKSWTRTRASSSGPMKVVGQLQVGVDRQLLLVKIADHNYLIGASAAGIQLLSEIEGELPGEEAAEEAPLDNPFRELMKKYASLQEKKKGGSL